MYTYTWKKYLPVIRLLLKKAADTNQEIKIDRMDFEKGTRSRKTLGSFNIEVARGRLLTISPPVAARDLYDVLVDDDIARKLIHLNSYEILFGSDFTLRIKNQNPENKVIAE
jgi:hypothetical protein